MLLLIQIKAVFLAVILLIFVLLPACLIAAPFPLHRRLKIVCPVWGFCSEILLRYACHAHLDVQLDLRSETYRGTPPYGLYVANHQSFIDIPLILTMLQSPPIMKKEVLYIPIFGWLGHVSGAMPVARERGDSRRKVFEQSKHRILNEKIGIQIYPEGTRSKDGLPRPHEAIKRSLLVFAFQENIPVIPISLYGSRGVLAPLGHIRPGKHLGIIVHKEVLPKDFSSADEFTHYVWGKVIEGHDELKLELSPLNSLPS
jgi:1-acyl-sn-glycerol-3-phosphate acyltransferase